MSDRAAVVARHRYGVAKAGRRGTNRGIARRLSAFDGSLAVSSPSGGPTELTMELPCALSSPKISHSCGTA